MSYSRRDPVIHTVAIKDLRPTQITVGLREVERKRKAWGAKDKDKRAETLGTHMAPVVLGPDGARYITDHHHLARALADDGEKGIYVSVIGDLSKSDPAHFWNLMDFHGWTHPFDERGRRCAYADLPKSVGQLRDDPYRSLSGALRRLGAFAKDSTPYSEFVWADFYRDRIKPKDLKNNFDDMLSLALNLAKSGDADYLPGWCGAHEEPPHEATASETPRKRPAPRKK